MSYLQLQVYNPQEILAMEIEEGERENYQQQLPRKLEEIP
jgi:hypothetical protein